MIKIIFLSFFLYTYNGLLAQNNVEIKEIKSEIMHSNNLNKNLNENSNEIKNKEDREDIKVKNNKK